MPSGTQTGAFDAIITFSEVVSDFVQSGVSLSGTATASITDWNDHGLPTPSLQLTITPTSSGTVTLDIAADVATDAADNSNTPATEQTVNVNIATLRQTVNVDVDPPGVSISAGGQGDVLPANVFCDSYVHRTRETRRI